MGTRGQCLMCGEAIYFPLSSVYYKEKRPLRWLVLRKSVYRDSKGTYHSMLRDSPYLSLKSAKAGSLHLNPPTRWDRRAI